MTRYGEEFLINEEDEIWFAIVEFMNDEVREQVHFELSPCTNEEFLKRYLELDSEFEELLRIAFDIVMNDIVICH